MSREESHSWRREVVSYIGWGTSGVEKEDGPQDVVGSRAVEDGYIWHLGQIVGKVEADE
jgi:hypothetical protein